MYVIYILQLIKLSKTQLCKCLVYFKGMKLSRMILPSCIIFMIINMFISSNTFSVVLPIRLTAQVKHKSKHAICDECKWLHVCNLHFESLSSDSSARLEFVRASSKTPQVAWSWACLNHIFKTISKHFLCPFWSFSIPSRTLASSPKFKPTPLHNVQYFVRIWSMLTASAIWSANEVECI